MPVGAHTFLSLLAEPLNQLTDSAEGHDVSENLEEFNDWLCCKSLTPHIIKSIYSTNHMLYCSLYSLTKKALTL